MGAVPRGPLAAAEALRGELSGFEPELVSGQDCAVLAEELARTEKACAAAGARAALRAEACGAHRARGFPDADEWLARASGSSAAQARAALGTAGAVEACPQTRKAMASGELSMAQAKEIATTEADCPGSEEELLSLAKESSLGELRDTARTRRLRAMDPEDLHARQHRARSLRHWRDEAGMVCVGGALAPEVGVPLVNRLDAEADRLRRAARKQGHHEARQAHVADALVALVSGEARARANAADMVIVCDLSAYRRGRTGPGEVCHILGGGPIPVGLARQLSADAFLKAVVHDGVRIHTVCHFGRHIKAELRTALELGAPPGLEGVRCADCAKRHGLEWDHVDPLANRGPTSYENMRPRCWGCHHDKTERDREAGLLGGMRDERGPP